MLSLGKYHKSLNACSSCRSLRVYVCIQCVASAASTASAANTSANATNTTVCFVFYTCTWLLATSSLNALSAQKVPNTWGHLATFELAWIFIFYFVYLPDNGFFYSVVFCSLAHPFFADLETKTNVTWHFTMRYFEGLEQHSRS